MKKNKTIKTATLLISSIVFNLIFWGEYIGLNLLLLSVILVAITLYFHSDARKSVPVIITICGVLITGILVI